MSDEINDGGPAFPCEWKDFQPITGTQVVREQFDGMTLRDYFAAKAMAAFIISKSYSEASQDIIASYAYAQADAMLKERGSK